MGSENDFLEAAKRHYEVLMAGDEAGWRETLSSVAKGDGRPEQWWKAGRAMVENQGVRYEFKGVDEARSKDGHKRIFFRRLKVDGSEVGRPVPADVVQEGGRWLVVSASY